MTEKQQKALQFITKYIESHDGISPSYEEIMVALGIHSKNGVHRLVTALEERGKLRRVPFLARSIEIVSDRCPSCGRAA